MNAPPLPPGIDEFALFRTLFMASPDALIVAGADGVIVLANAAAGRLLAYPLTSLQGMNVDELVPDAIRSKHAAYRASYEGNPRPRPMGTQMDLVARRGDGTEVMVEIALSPLQQHGLPYVMAAIRDIATYPRVKQALRRARYSEHLAQLGRMAVDMREVQALLAQAPTTVAQALQLDVARLFLLEPGRQRLRVAAAVGGGAQGQVGAFVANLPATAPGFVLATAAPVTVGPHADETRFEVPADDRALACALSVPLLDRDGPMGVFTVASRQPMALGDDEVGFLQSVSNLLTTSLQRAQTEEALRHSQRLESVGQLTGGIAHDFNNLLTIIQGNLQVLEELPLLQADPYAQDLVGAATRASRRGAELTGKLLAFSRRQVLQPEPVDLGAMLRSLADMLRRTLDQRIAIEVDAAADCPPVLADPGQLESALLNIAINARDAMPEGGTLCFGARACPALPLEVRGGLDDPSAPVGGFVAISVSDTGTGMPDEVKERAFEPFFTTKAAGRGTGLGLSTVYGFAKQSRGAVSIDSAPGRGTMLTLYIPRPWQHGSGPGEVVDSGRVVPAGLSVLLVEDDTEVRAVAQRFLEALHARVTAVINAEQALLALQGGQGFDLLLSDIALGAGMRGTELAALAQQRFPGMAVLLMSGFSADLIDADRTSPADWELLPKPYSRQELAAAIARTLDAR